MRLGLIGFVSAAALLFAGTSVAQNKYGPGANDREIKIGQTIPYSGPASAFGAYGRVWIAYFNMINEKGGINGRKVTVLSLDNGFNPPKAVEATRKLVEEDNVLAEMGTVGTVPNASVQRYLNGRKVPQIMISAGGSRFNDPEGSPWTVPFYPTFDMEAAVYARHVLQTKPDARIAVLFQNDDYGKDFLKGLKEGLGDKAKSMIVAEASYELTDPTVDSQIISLSSSKADVLMQFTTPKFAAQTIRKVADLGWKPTQYIVSPSSSVQATLIPAGVEISKGLISAQFAKQPTEASAAADQDVREYLEFMKKYAPNENPADFLGISGYINAAMSAEVLRRAGNDLTRENLIKQATSIKDVRVPMVMDGIVFENNSKNHRLFHQLQLAQFDGSSWVPMGQVIAVQEAKR